MVCRPNHLIFMLNTDRKLASHHVQWIWNISEKPRQNCDISCTKMWGELLVYLSVASCAIETLYPLSQISEQIRRAERVPLQYSLYMSRRENHITMLNDIRGLAPRVSATLPHIILSPPAITAAAAVTFTKINIPRVYRPLSNWAANICCFIMAFFKVWLFSIPNQWRPVSF